MMRTTDWWREDWGLDGGLGAVGVALLLTVTACSGTTPDSSETNDEQTAESSETGQENADLPGEPRPNKPGRIKEGMHIRPGIEFAELTRQEAEQHVEFTDDRKWAYATGPAREKIEGKGRQDVLMSPDFLHQIGGRPIETDRGLKVDVRPFSLVSVIWGDFEMTFSLDGDRTVTDRPSEEADDLPPPYRTRPQANHERPSPYLNLWSKEDLLFDGEVQVNGGFGEDSKVEFSMNRNTEATFHGRIPLISDDYVCENPDYTFSTGCVRGRCLVDEDFCVEELGLEVRLGAEVDALIDFWVSGDLRKDSDLNPFFEKRLGSVPIPPGGILSLGADFVAGWSYWFRVMGELDFDVDVGGTINGTAGFLYEDGEGVNFNNDFSIEGGDGGLGLEKAAQFLARIAVEAGFELFAAPTATANVPGVTADFKIARATLEARWDTIFSLNPVSEQEAQHENNGVPEHFEGSCLRSKFVAGPFVTPLLDVELGVEGNIKKFDLLESLKLYYRPFQHYFTGAHGGGDFCWGEDEREDRESIEVPEPKPRGDESAPTFKVDASWKADTDIDLEVKTPDGTHFGPGHTKEAGAGKYPHDVCGGDIPCTGGDENNSESVIYQPASEAPRGTYRVKVTNDSGERSADVKLQTRNGGRIYDDAQVDLSASSGASSGWIELEK